MSDSYELLRGNTSEDLLQNADCVLTKQFCKWRHKVEQHHTNAVCHQHQAKALKISRKFYINFRKDMVVVNEKSFIEDTCNPITATAPFSAELRAPLSAASLFNVHSAIALLHADCFPRFHVHASSGRFCSRANRSLSSISVQVKPVKSRRADDVENT